jgi:hypothetical protein
MKSKLIITGLVLESLLAGAADMTRNDINKQLSELAKKPVPEKLSPGAMCYSIAISANRVEYHCPSCKTKTFYNSNHAPKINFSTGIEQIRKWTVELKKLGLDCKIDESDFCPKCSKNKKFDKKHFRTLYWVITIDKRIIRNKIKSLDYQILTAFLAKKTKVKTFAGREESLKKYIPRLRQLLGITRVNKHKKSL